MGYSTGLILKVLGLSLVVSVAIKYVVPLLHIPATVSVALTLILLPCIIMVGLLGWRTVQTHGHNADH